MQIEGRSKSEKHVARHRKESFIKQRPGATPLEQSQRPLTLYGAGMAFPWVTIASLPNDVLLTIFDFYLVTGGNWHKLVHVCRRWRYVVFASPLRLDLQLLCTPESPVRELLGIWPTFPLNIRFMLSGRQRDYDHDNLIAALESPDRVREIILFDLTSPLWEQIASVMQEPFLAMTSLYLHSFRAFRVPDTFLNGSAPCLQGLLLSGISFPLLPRLLLSASDLTVVRLRRIPNTGYIPPEAMATCLSALTKLEILAIEFQSPTPGPKRRNRRLPPSTRTVLPALTYLEFRGVSEYLEVLAARIDAPLLRKVLITCFNQFVFDIPQISRFVGHLKLPTSYGLFLDFSPCRQASIYCSQQRQSSRSERAFDWRVLGEGLDWQVFSLAQICSQISCLCSRVESLSIEFSNYLTGNRQDDMDPTLWLQLFRSSTSVQSLDISAKLEPFIAAGLQGLTGESAAEVLPALQSLSIVEDTSDSAAQRDIESFVSARQHSDHPIAVHRSNRWTLDEDSDTDEDPDT
jgi:F-box-like